MFTYGEVEAAVKARFEKTQIRESILGQMAKVLRA